MRIFKVSKESKLSLEEKVELIRTYDIDDLHQILKEFELHPKNYDKPVIIEVINNLFEKGVTSI